MNAARARLQVYEGSNKKVSHSPYDLLYDIIEKNDTSPHTTPTLNVMAPPYRPTHTDVTALAQAVQDSISVNRLQTPAPPVLDGNPINFIQWKMLLNDQRNIPDADKLYYVKKYVCGAACKAPGVFYRNDDDTYQDAWNKLNHSYGHPFTFQRAFRD